MPVTQKRKPKGLPSRTGKPSMKAKTQRHFAKLIEKKFNRVLAHEGLEPSKAWKLKALK